jgi:hypothetical protein
MVRRFTRARVLVPGEVKKPCTPPPQSPLLRATGSPSLGQEPTEKGTSLSAEQKVATLEDLEEALIFAKAVISERLEADLRQALILARQELQLNNSTKPGADSSSAQHAAVALRGLRRAPIFFSGSAKE